MNEPMKNVDPNYPNKPNKQLHYILVEAIAAYKLATKHVNKKSKDAFGLALLSSYRSFLRNPSRLKAKQKKSLARLFAVLTTKKLSDYYKKSINFLLEDSETANENMAALTLIINSDTDIISTMSPYVFIDNNYSLQELIYCILVIENPAQLKEDENSSQSKQVEKILGSSKLKKASEELIEYSLKMGL